MSDNRFEDLWGDRESDGAARNAPTLLSQRRNPLHGPTASVVTGPGGDALQFDPAAVVARRFERAVKARRIPTASSTTTLPALPRQIVQWMS